MTWAYVTEHLPAIATAAGGLGAGGLLKTWLDHKRAARRQTDEVALSLVEQLKGRVGTLEAGAAQERALCDAHMAVLRHRVSNLSGSFDSLLMMAEMAPEHAQAFAARIRERRAAQEQAEAAEKAAVAAAVIAMTAPREQAS